jgi:hypothetical protein
MPAYSKADQLGGWSRTKKREAKPAKGPTAKARAKKGRTIVQAERAIKTQAKYLDGYRCRWPDCDVPPDRYWGGIEAAHYEAEGMGGDPTLIRCTVENLIALCRFHHRGPRGIDGSGLAKLVPTTDQKMRGPVECYVQERGESGRWLLVGVTSPPPANELEAHC